MGRDRKRADFVSVWEETFCQRTPVQRFWGERVHNPLQKIRDKTTKAGKNKRRVRIVGNWVFEYKWAKRI